MAQVTYIRFDVDFFDKPKIKGLAYRCGQEAVLLLVRLLCAMGRATNGEISRDAWEAIGAENGLNQEKTLSCITYMIDQGILGGTLESLTNERVKQDQSALEKKREATRERVAKNRQKKESEDLATLNSATATVRRLDTPLINPNLIPGFIHSEVHANHSAEPETFDTTDPNMAIALEKLESPAGQPWVNDNRFINAGRRPMKDYKLLWLTPGELADVVKKLEESDIPVQMYKDLFKKAEAKLKTYSTQGKSSQSVSVYNWLTGFLFDELLERTIKEARLAKTMEGPQRYEQRR